MKKILQKLIGVLPLWLRKRIKDIPILKQLQGALVKKYLDHSEFDAVISAGPAKGLHFPVRMPDDKLMFIGTWEIDFSNALSSAVQRGWVCYDVGGYKGYYAGIMALRGASKVYVFEPMPENIHRIERLIELNSRLPVQLIKAAVSDEDGSAVFRIMDEATMGKLESSTFQRSETSVKEISVQCVRLDTLIGDKKIEAPDFIKIDVEGAEAFVLEGAMNMLREKRPVLMIEIHSKEIGMKVNEMLKPIYNRITVFETGGSPETNTLEICHFVVKHT